MSKETILSTLDGLVVEELRLQGHEFPIEGMPEPLRFSISISDENRHIFSEGEVQKATANKYIRELRKFWRKKLSHIKKPRERKRKIVDRHVFATIQRHKSQSKPTTT